MRTPAWKVAQQITPGSGTTDILIGQGTISPCDFDDTANVLSTPTQGPDAVEHTFVASFPISQAVVLIAPVNQNYVSMKGGLAGTGSFVC